MFIFLFVRFYLFLRLQFLLGFLTPWLETISVHLYCMCQILVFNAINTIVTVMKGNSRIDWLSLGRGMDQWKWYYPRVPDEGYSWNASWTLDLISTFLSLQNYKRICIGNEESVCTCRNMTYWYIIAYKSPFIDTLKWKYDPVILLKAEKLIAAQYLV